MNENRLQIKTTVELTRLRNLLDGISQISWSFSVLNKQNPISVITQSEADELISAYRNLLDDAKQIIGRA